MLKVKGWKVYSRQMKTKRKAEIIISMSDKIDFKSKAIMRQSHYTMIKWPNHQENIIIKYTQAKNQRGHT